MSEISTFESHYLLLTKISYYDLTSVNKKKHLIMTQIFYVMLVIAVLMKLNQLMSLTLTYALFWKGILILIWSLT